MKNNTLRFLWIDDTEDWSKITIKNITLLFKDVGITLIVDWFKNGDNIRPNLMRTDYDGVLIDYDLGAENGVSYITQIREHNQWNELLIILYSSNTNTDLASLVQDTANIKIAYRPNLNETILDHFSH